MDVYVYLNSNNTSLDYKKITVINQRYIQK